ncbi:MAG: hypothetical protein NC418_04670 [Muribaculaceae bacterium]|nr:hypothetical protein [Muribaculaceae bacterium]
MKKILLSLGAVMLGAVMANADVVIESTSQSYATLQEAINAAAAGDVLLVNGSAVLPNSRMGIAKSLTIKGDTEDATIVRGRSAKNILINSGAKVTFEAITFDGGTPAVSNDRFMEVSAGNTKAYFNNVKFTNFNLPSGLIEVKNSGTVELNGVKGTNNICTKGEVFIGSNGSKITGDNNLGIFLERTNNISAENITNEEPIALFVDFPARTNKSALVTGCDDVTKFAINHPYYTISVNGGVLVAEMKSIVDAAGNNYTDLQVAVDAVQDTDAPELTLVSDFRLPNNRITIRGSLTIKGADGVTPSFTRYLDGRVAILINNQNEVTFENLKFDMDKRSGKNHFIEVTADGTTANFKNVIFFNFPESYRTENIYNGYLQIVFGATALLENVKFEYPADATPAATGAFAGPFDVKIGTGNVTLVGDNNFSLYLDGTNKVKVATLTNEKPIMLTLATPERVFVEGAKVADKFVSSTLDYEVQADADGNTMLAVAPFVKIDGNTMVFTEIADGLYKAQGAIDGEFTIRTKEPLAAAVYYTLAEGTDFATATNLPLAEGSAAIVADAANYTVLFDANAKTLALYSYAELMPETSMYMHGTFYDRHFDLGWPVEPSNVSIDESGVATYTFDDILLEAAADDPDAAYFVLSSWKADARELAKGSVMKAAPNAMTTEAIKAKAAEIKGHRYYADFASLAEGESNESNITVHVDGADAKSAPLFKVKPGYYSLEARVTKDGDNIMTLGYQGVTTGVESVSAAEAAVVNVYSLQGVLIRAAVEAADATEGLPAGIYIVDGRKVYVK